MRGGTGWALACFVLLTGWLFTPASATAADRPNVVWITCEDMGRIIGPYGDRNAVTPNLDEFAKTALKYRFCWSNAPVCAPARTTLITGMYATSLGAEHMRSQVPLPSDWQLYPQVLRQAGYYCTNNSKTDYNIVGNGKVWDESSNKAHWKNRKADQPFFAVFNNTQTHESGVHQPHPLTHDPATMRIPAYQPDLPEIRRDWAQYYDNVTTMDQFVGDRLKELAEAGLMENTIVWFYSDHGTGLPRNKRVPFDSGLGVPLLVHIPEKFKHLRPDDYAPGGTTQRLVSFVDFGPTLLSLCGVQPPANMQGQAYLGTHATTPRSFVFGYRSRMDERLDLVRSISDGRYVYVKNFRPDRPQGQYLAYMYRQAGIQAWRKQFEAGTLPPEQAAFFLPKPAEHLFDLQTDPDEVRNLANSPEYSAIRDRLRAALIEHLVSTCDLGLLPESEAHRLAAGRPLVELRNHPELFPVKQVLEAALLASSEADSDITPCKLNLASPNPANRYWGITGLLMRGTGQVTPVAKDLEPLLKDESFAVRIAAAQALGLAGSEAQKTAAVDALIQLSNPAHSNLPAAIEALNALDALSPLSPDQLTRVKEQAVVADTIPQRLREYVPRLMERLIQVAQSGTR